MQTASLSTMIRLMATLIHANLLNVNNDELVCASILATSSQILPFWEITQGLAIWKNYLPVPFIYALVSRVVNVQ